MDSILTVVAPASSHDLTVLAAVKAEVGVPADNVSRDAELSRMIRQASGAIAAYCNRVFGLESLSEMFRIQVGHYDTLILSRQPIDEIESVVESVETLTEDDYEIDRGAGLLYRLDGDERACWPVGKIVVNYTAGYELLDGLPHDIERAAILLVKQYWFASRRDPLVKSEDIPGVIAQQFWIGGVGDNGALPPDVIDLLAPHRSLMGMVR